jgi:hypothetical protein
MNLPMASTTEPLQIKLMLRCVAFMVMPTDVFRLLAAPSALLWSYKITPPKRSTDSVIGVSAFKVHGSPPAMTRSIAARQIASSWRIRSPLDIPAPRLA